MKQKLLKRLRLWHIVVPLLALANIVYLTHNPLGWAITLGFFLFAPGYLFLRTLRQQLPSGWVVASISLGLSLSTIIITALVLNSFRVFGIDRPLETVWIFTALNIVTLIFLACNKQRLGEVRLPKFNYGLEELILRVAVTILPLLAIGGAMRLNNGASNILTMLMMGLVGILVIYLSFRPKLYRAFPYTIFMFALAFLFANSLRGWIITGHDIHHEFSVFQIVMNNGFWSPRTVHGDPYNACLSITLLPTVIAKLTAIPDYYVFKVVYQVIFAAMLPSLYFLFRRFAGKVIAFLGVFAFMTFPTFINDLPFLNRQEIAFAFFILVMLVNFLKISLKAKTILTTIFLLSLILSHYSSSYATIGLFLSSLILFKILNGFSKPKEKFKIPLLRLPIIIIALLTTFVWNAQITASSSNLTNTLSSTIKGLFVKDSEQSNFFKYNLLAKSTLPDTPENQFANFAEKKGSDAKFAEPPEIPITSIGAAIDRVTDVRSLNVLLHSSVAKILQLFVLIGTIILFVRYRKSKGVEPRKTYFMAFVISCIGGLVLFTFLPQLSIGYDITRLFQQSMTVLWLPIILAARFLFGWLKGFKTNAAAGILVFLYWTMSGFIPQVTGGYLPNLALNNSGYYFDYFYTHKSDVVATDWLAVNRVRWKNVFMDTNAAAPPLKYPVAVGIMNNRMTGYIYLDYTNTNRDIYRIFLSSGFVEYTNNGFLEPSNVIYSNNDSRIYQK